MARTLVVAGALLLGVGAAMAQQEIAVKQDNLMRAQAKSLYTVMLKTTKGEIPYDQAAIDAAIAQLEQSVPTIASVFAINPKEDVVNATYGSSQKSGRTRLISIRRYRLSPRRSRMQRARSRMSPA